MPPGVPALLAGAALLLAALHTSAEPLRISGTMQAAGDVKAGTPASLPRTTVNGQSTVFIADAETDNRDELYIVPSGGGARTKLSGTFANPSGNVVNFLLTPDGQRVLFVADKDVAGKFELWGATLSGSLVINLSGTLAAGGYVTNSYKLSPDGTRVVFLAYKDSTTQAELYSQATNTGAFAPLKVSGPMIATGQALGDFVITPDSSRVVFRANREVVSEVELYIASITAPSPLKVSGTMVAGGDVLQMDVMPDGSRVIYRATAENINVPELFSASITAGIGAPVKISGALVAGGEVTDFKIAPNNSRIVYRSDKLVDERFELWGTSPTGGNYLLGPTPVAGGGLIDFAISPDSSRVVYRADRDVVGVIELYSAPILGGLNATLSGGMVANGDVAGDYLIAPDSSRVVFRADKDTDNVFELYSAPLAGGTVVKVSGTMVAGGSIGNAGAGSGRFAITPDSARVVFVANRNVPTVDELWGTTLAGGTPSRLSGALVANGNVANFTISPTGHPVTFVADKDNDNVFELYATFAGGLVMDVDGNGFADPLTDGILMLRWLFGLRGNSLIAGAIGPNATRTTAAEIESFLIKLDTLLGPN